LQVIAIREQRRLACSLLRRPLPTSRPRGSDQAKAGRFLFLKTAKTSA
jgi:hypothetical protein